MTRTIEVCKMAFSEVQKNITFFLQEYEAMKKTATAAEASAININDLISMEPPTAHKIDVATELLGSLCDGGELVKLNPEKAAALMEMAWLIWNEIEGALIDHMTKTDQCYLSFVASGNLPRCLLLLNSGELTMEY